jgi:ABC-type phosphate/phosphonate transport system substrate-binding protein
MAIPNAKKYRIRRPNSSEEATIVAVLPKNADVQAYIADAAKRFDWKAFDEQKASMNKVRVGQQKQRKR